jgi:hypothetical protein
MPRETAYRGYRIEFTSYEVLEEPPGRVAAAVVLDRDELRRYPIRDTADARPSN